MKYHREVMRSFIPLVCVFTAVLVLQGCCGDGGEGVFGWCIPDTTAANDVCAARYNRSSGSGGEKLAASRYIWEHHVSEKLLFTVRFLNGDSWQRAQVQRIAAEWTTASKGKLLLKFLEDDSDDPALIRIRFQVKGPSWSDVGSSTDLGDQSAATMVFGWVDPREDSLAVRSVILHEFGHAFGFIHEHQQPKAEIPWKKEKAREYYLYYNPTWDEDDVEEYVFHRLEEGESNSSDYDRWSIMHYAIPDSITEGDFAIGLRTRLSRGDIKFLRTVYPLETCNTGKCHIDGEGRRTSVSNLHEKTVGGVRIVGI